MKLKQRLSRDIAQAQILNRSLFVCFGGFFLFLSFFFIIGTNKKWICCRISKSLFWNKFFTYILIWLNYCWIDIRFSPTTFKWNNIQHNSLSLHYCRHPGNWIRRISRIDGIRSIIEFDYIQPTEDLFFDLTFVCINQSYRMIDILVIKCSRKIG